MANAADAQMPTIKSSDPTVWLKHPVTGDKRAFPESLATWYLKNRPGWTKTTPDENVPKVKRYPDDIFLTEAGEKRRKNLREKSKSILVQEEEVSVAAPEVTEGEAVERAETGELLSRAEIRLLDWQVLRKYARSRGLNIKKMRREEILLQLDRSAP